MREEPDGGLGALVEFATDLYDRATVERWMRHYARLLEALVADLDVPVGMAEMMEGEERALVLGAWNRTDAPLAADETLPALLAAQARRTPDAAALVAGDETITYGELDRRADRLARRLRARGRPGVARRPPAGALRGDGVGMLGVLEGGRRVRAAGPGVSRGPPPLHGGGRGPGPDPGGRGAGRPLPRHRRPRPLSGSSGGRHRDG